MESKYDKTALVYNKRYKKIQREKYKIMLSGLKLKGKILDHGCGTGLLSKFLNKDLIGVDSSAEMLKIRGSGDLADAEKLPYKDAEFDFVLSFTTLQNCKNPEKAIREVKRVLKLPFPSHLSGFCLYLQYKSEAKNQYQSKDNLENQANMVNKNALPERGIFICTFLRAFEPKLKRLLEKHFKILEKRPCGEDIGFILSS